MLQWDWKEKVGSLKIVNRIGEEVNISIYKGNALMIFIYENDSDDTYQLYSFFADKEHLKNLMKEDDFFNDWKSVELWKMEKDFDFVIKNLYKKGVEIYLTNLPF